MVKLKHLRAYKLKDVPEEVRQELWNLAKEMTLAMAPVIEHKDANLILAAFNQIQAAMINSFISDDPYEKAKGTVAFAVDLIRNVELAAGIKIFDLLKDVNLEDPNQNPQSS